MGRAIGIELLLSVGVLLTLCGIVVILSAVTSMARPPRSREDRRVSRNRARFQRARLRRARRTTPWAHYSRPHLELPVQLVGIERVWRGHVLNRKQLAAVPIDDRDARLNAEGLAIMAAHDHNTSRAGMDTEL